MSPVNFNDKREFKKDVYGIVLIASALLLAVCLVLGEKAGLVGGFIYRFINFFVGTGSSWVVPSLIFMLGLLFIFNVSVTHLKSRTIGFFLLLMAILGFSHLLMLRDDIFVNALTRGLEGKGGGLLGALLVFLLDKAFGSLGMKIILSTLALLGLLILTRFPLFLYFKSLLQWIKSNLAALWQDKTQSQVSASADTPKIVPPATKEDMATELKQEFVIEAVDIKDDTTPDLKEDTADKGEESEQQETETEGEVLQLNITDQVIKDYHYPPLDLLTSKPNSQNFQEQDIKAQAKTIEDTLRNFNIEANVIKVSVGPTITRYELQIAAGIKVSRVTALADDIALSLAAQGIRIEAPIPGKSAIGIEVPNEENSIVYFKDVVQDERYQKSKKPLTVALGLGISGQTVVTDLAKMPHVLIAGATGSGKSVCINVFINSILYKSTPEQVKFLLIDPKRVELSVYNGMPHLLAPVVTNPKKAATALYWVIEEMDKRYEAFAKKGARDIERYNQIIIEEQENSENPLPLIVVIIDELADLMMVASKDVEDAICRLAQMGRAAGIHLVIGTQRPSVDVITGLIKANIPARIAFAVSSGIDSRTILDMIGAEKLLGKGDMLFAPQGLNKPVRIQGAYISDEEVERVVGFVSKQRIVEYKQQDFKVKEPETEQLAELDPLFADAVRLVLDQGSASISMLQRRFRIGYTRAARIIDQLELQGIVGGYEGSKARKVYADAAAAVNLLNDKE